MVCVAQQYTTGEEYLDILRPHGMMKLPGFSLVSRSNIHRLILKEKFVFKKRNIKMKIYQHLDIVEE